MSKLYQQLAPSLSRLKQEVLLRHFLELSPQLGHGQQLFCHSQQGHAAGMQGTKGQGCGTWREELRSAHTLPKTASCKEVLW